MMSVQIIFVNDIHHQAKKIIQCMLKKQNYVNLNVLLPKKKQNKNDDDNKNFLLMETFVLKRMDKLKQTKNVFKKTDQ